MLLTKYKFLPRLSIILILAYPIKETISSIEIDPANETMKTTDLHKIVFANTGKHEKLRNFHVKIRNVLGIQSNGDGVAFKPSLDSRGYVAHYNLDETECHMIMASVDSKHLRMIVTIFIEARNAALKPKTRLELAIEQVKLIKELEATQLKLEKKSIKLDESMEWMSIKRIAKINGVTWQSLSWQKLKAHGLATNKPPQKKFDANYGTVNTDHVRYILNWAET